MPKYKGSRVFDKKAIYHIVKKYFMKIGKCYVKMKKISNYKVHVI